MKYYGFIVSELTGNIENIEGEHEHKPSFESVGFSYCRWFTTEAERMEQRARTTVAIKEIQCQTKQESTSV